MKLAFYEWGAISTSMIALCGFTYWAVSVSTGRADFETFLPLGHWNSTQILAANGNITINDRYGSLEEIEEVSKYRIVNPPLTSKTRCAAPGFLYQSMDWGGQLSWSLRLSLLIPTLLMTLAAAFFIHGYLRIRRQTLSRLQSVSRRRSSAASAGA